jgi:hypothetical protein
LNLNLDLKSAFKWKVFGLIASALILITATAVLVSVLIYTYTRYRKYHQILNEENDSQYRNTSLNKVFKHSRPTDSPNYVAPPIKKAPVYQRTNVFKTFIRRIGRATATPAPTGPALIGGQIHSSLDQFSNIRNSPSYIAPYTGQIN